jgi:hypothetical protein
MLGILYTRPPNSFAVPLHAGGERNDLDTDQRANCSASFCPNFFLNYQYRIIAALARFASQLYHVHTMTRMLAGNFYFTWFFEAKPRGPGCVHSYD